MKVGKPKSKRVPVRLRHKIEKASAAKQRKDRKEAKKNPQWRSRLKKDPGIPNLFPFKDKVLAEIEESRRKKEEETLRRREVAKAQRLGTAVVPEGVAVGAKAEDEDEALIDPEDLEEEDDDNDDDDDDAMEEDDKNPMAALLASAQARAHHFGKDVGSKNDHGEDDDDEKESDEEEWTGVKDTTANGGKKGGPTRKMLPKQAIDEPIKAVSLLLERLQRTQDGVQAVLDHYRIPPLVTAGSDTTTRFLVEVARKRGRLGRGGVPNLPAAALTVLSDINDERLQLPALAPAHKPAIASTDKGQVQIVSRMAEPFRIEGLFGDEASAKAQRGTEMEVEA